MLKAAYHDPNPVVFLEHKGLYWSKVKGTDAARTIEPAEDYILPLGKAIVYKKYGNKMKKKHDCSNLWYGSSLGVKCN